MASRNSEPYRKAALALANASQRQGSNRSVIFASATAGEGATTAAINVGRHLINDAGLHPVLIEVNRFRPALVRLFGLDPDKSLAAVAGGARASGCVQRDPAGLALIPSGDLDAADLPERIEPLLCRTTQELRNEFDFILFDVPPVLESADVLIAGRIVPDLILVVGTGHASQESVREACRELREAHIHIMGAILNEQKRILPRWLDRK